MRAKVWFRPQPCAGNAQPPRAAPKQVSSSPKSIREGPTAPPNNAEMTCEGPKRVSNRPESIREDPTAPPNNAEMTRAGPKPSADSAELSRAVPIGSIFSHSDLPERLSIIC